MKYREMEYSIGDNGNGKWGWKIHRQLDPRLMRPIRSGEADSYGEAIVMAKAAIDTVLDKKSN